MSGNRIARTQVGAGLRARLSWRWDSCLAWRWGGHRIAALGTAFAVLAGAPLVVASPASADTTTSVVGDPGWVPNVAAQIGATGLWKNGATGSGVGVALIDTGVDPVPGLSSGNVIQGPDLSATAGVPGMVGLDGYGHGTFMASIIAGRDTGTQSSSAFTGIAPNATLVNVKVGAPDGSVDPSQVIAALDWVAAHHGDPGVNIRVVNLSYGSNSTQSYLNDPVAAAVERVWKAGVVVAVAAGNDGQQNALLTDPAIDPYVIAVGANGSYDSQGQKLFVTSFTNSGNYGRHVDIAAPGSSIVGLRDPGSYVDVFHTEGMVPVDATGRYFRGSGTSEATAVVSGVVALLTAHYPSLTPDQVKNVLMASATPLFGATANMVGAGNLDAGAADQLAGQLVAAGGTLPSTAAGAALRKLPDHGGPQAWAPATGAGSLEASRGGEHVAIGGSSLTGESTVFGTTYDATQAASSTAALDAASWGGGSWTGHRWSGHRWSGDDWSGHRWSSDNWDGHRWSSGDWSSTQWAGALWDSTNWDGAAWSGNNWGQPASQVSFSSPSGVAVDPSGNRWIADTGNNQVDKFNPSGVQLTIVSTSGNGAGVHGLLNKPGGIATDSAGNLYVADTGNNQVEEYTSTGTFMRAFTADGLAGEHGTPEQLKAPSGVTVDTGGNVYVADTGNNRVEKFNSAGTFLSAITTNGLIVHGVPGSLKGPMAVAVDPAGNVYVADTGNNRVEQFSPTGTFVRAFTANANPALPNPSMNAPQGLALDGAGTLYVADTGNNQIERITTATGAEVYWTTVGSGLFAKPTAVAVDAAGAVYIANDGTAQIEIAGPDGVLLSTMGVSSLVTSDLNKPSAVVLDAAGNRYIADAGNNRIVKSTGTGVYLTAITTDGLANGTLNKPAGVAIGAGGNLWVADTGNDRVEEFTPTGTFITAITTNGLNPATAKTTALSGPAAVATDIAGNVYVADTGNNRVEKYSPTGTFLRAFTTNGQAVGNTLLSGPSGVAVDAAGNVYISDTGNNRVEKFTPAGVFVTAWDNSGTPKNPTMNGPAGITLDSAGNLWVADAGNNQLDQINLASGAVTGWTNSVSATGQGTMSKPGDMVVDAAGNVFVADTGNGQIDQFNANNIVLSTIGANNTLATPAGDAVDSAGNTYVADQRNNRIAKYGPNGAYIMSFNLDGNGAGQSGFMAGPTGVAVDTSGNVWVADTGNNQVEQYTNTGIYIRALRASGLTAVNTTTMKGPQAVKVDANGNVYVADTGNNRIEKFNSAGTFLSAITTSGLTVNGKPVSLKAPAGVTVDAGGNVYVADTGNNRVEKFNSAGAFVSAITTSGLTVNGKPVSLKAPAGVTVDAGGNVYVADTGNNRVEKFNSAGTFVSAITTSGLTVNGKPGQLSAPLGLALNPLGNVYVADTGNNRIETFSAAGAFLSAVGTS